MPAKKRRSAARSEAESASKESSKRAKNALRSIAQENICPVSHGLMVDPVMAEDGCLYERKSIEEVIRRKGGSLRSPMTNNPMGSKIMIARNARNIIESLVSSNLIDDEDLVAGYHERKLVLDAQKAIGLKMKQKAEDGDPVAMVSLGLMFDNGIHGFEKDYKLAYRWFTKSADLGNIHGMGHVGFCFLWGHGVDKNVAHGTALLVRAAENGSGYACYVLGLYYSRGRYGFPKDKKEAKHWLTKSLDSELFKDKAASKLRELEDDQEE